MHQLVTHRRVEFADTDMAKIVHFSRFFDFMEAAEHEFLRQALASADRTEHREEQGEERQIHFELDGHEIGWPRVHATCDYSSPARLGDILEITVRLLRLGTKSLTWGFTFRCQDRLIAKGQITSICCRVGGTALEAIRIPPFLAAVLDDSPSGDKPFDGGTTHQLPIPVPVR